MSSIYSRAYILPTPLLARSEVIKGFGRGGKDLGCPTANLDLGPLKPDILALDAGIYYGWASVGSDPTVYKMVMSIGWNPFYKNEKMTVEPHLLHTFVEDFYGEILAISIVGYLRPELDYTTLEALKEAIAADITLAKNNLEGMEKPTSLTEA